LRFGSVIAASEVNLSIGRIQPFSANSPIHTRSTRATVRSPPEVKLSTSFSRVLS
jgi:hypothetical protein